MNNTQGQFLELLSNGIRDRETRKIYEDVNWREIIELSKSHKVEGIIYSAIRKSGMSSYIDDKCLSDLKTLTFKTGIGQLRDINNLSNIFGKFNETNIPVIVLKGLVVRDFYPNPEQRSMCDSDIFIHKEDLDKTKKLLFEIGYRLDDHEASHHIKLLHYKYPVIEVHWHIIKRDGFSGDIEKFEKMIWDNAINVSVGNSEVLSLCYDDLALHLCMHMAAHLASSGFGLRQLCDLVLLVEKMEDDINWDTFWDKTKMYGFEKFSLVIFELCHDLFKMKLPNGINKVKLNSSGNKYMKALTSEIFEAGVHGKKDMISNFGNQLAFNFEKKESNASVGALKRFLLFIFPPVNKMREGYDYAKKNRLLIPIAWMHHIFNGVFNSEYKVKDKVKFIIGGASVSIKKNKILNWLEL